MNDAPQRNRPGKVSDVLANLGAGLNPMKSCTFLVALGVTALAAWAWLKKSGEPRPPFPFYGTMAVSYAGGFLIGRVFWKLIKTTSVVAGWTRPAQLGARGHFESQRGGASGRHLGSD